MNLDDLEDVIASSGVTGADVVIALLLLAVGALGYYLTGRLVRRGLVRVRSISPDLVEVVSRILQFAVLWGFIALALNVLGARAGWLTFLLIALLAIGAFAAKPLIDGLMSSVAVASSSAIAAGEEVEVLDVAGTVRGLERRSTVVQTASGSRIHIPNSKLLDATVTVLTIGPERMSTIKFIVDHSVEVARLEEVVVPAVSSAPHIIRVDGLRVTSLEGGVTVAIDIWHGSKAAEELAAVDSANRSAIASLKSADITPK